MKRPPLQRCQAGATLVEFALGLVVFLTFFLGVMDFSRMLWTWGAATEATRWGARTSVVCGKDTGPVFERMRKFLPQLTADQLVVDWYDAQGLNNACSTSTCTAVNVRITGINFEWISPIGWTAGRLIPMPSFSTFLPREAMGQDTDSARLCAGV